MSTTTLLAFLQAYLVPGRPLPIEFATSCEELESYAEPGMRAQLCEMKNTGDGVLELVVDYTPFEAFNAQFEQSNYYDDNGRPTLTAREANFYEPRETLYVTADDPADKYFKPFDLGLSLLPEWQAAPNGQSYVAFLEARVAALQAQLAPPAPDASANNSSENDGPRKPAGPRPG